MTIKILSRRIGSDYEPFIIAEISANHNQSISKALKIIKVQQKRELMLLNYKLIHPTL